MSEWKPIGSEPSNGLAIWLSDGLDVWLGTAWEDGSLKTREKCKFWMPAVIPPPPLDESLLNEI
jgi:hypothetical protein